MSRLQNLFNETLAEQLDSTGAEFTLSVPFERFTEPKGMIEGRKRWRQLNGEFSFFETAGNLRAAEKINYPFSHPSSGNLRAILNRKILKLVQLVLRFSSIESPESDPQGCGKCRFRQEHEPAYLNMNAIFG